MRAADCSGTKERFKKVPGLKLPRVYVHKTHGIKNIVIRVGKPKVCGLIVYTYTYTADRSKPAQSCLSSC